MKRITIEVPEQGDEIRCFDVVLEDGRRCNVLSWDEMIGQVVSLTHPKLPGEPQYPMRTIEEWEAHMARLYARQQEHMVRSADQPPLAPCGGGA